MSATLWIACSERMPEDHQRVLAYFPAMKNAAGGAIQVGAVSRRDDGRSFTYGATTGHESHFSRLVFTHWMPLPKEPE